MLTHNFPSLFGAVNWLQLFTSTSRIYPITRWHSFTVSLSSCCCIFKYDSFSAFSWFMLLYRMPPHLPITAQSSHIHHLHHLISLSVMKESSATSIRTPWGGGKRPSIKKKSPWESKCQRLYDEARIITSAVTNIFFTAYRCLSWLKLYFTIHTQWPMAVEF